jgi:tRNA G10  N-methylase Trm11
MLPPKLARMMLNLGRGAWQAAHATEDTAKLTSVYDPFCGSGTVLLEALMLNFDVMGSDLDKDSVTGTQENLDWYCETYQQQVNSHVFYSDATNVTLDQVHQKIELIVTEPFLGKPTPQLAQLPNIYKGLEKLYWGVFRQWTKILADRAVVVIIFPYVQMEKHTFSLENLIDKLAELGYTPVSEPILYHRPLAVVQRQVWQFVYDKKGKVTK